MMTYVMIVKAAVAGTYIALLLAGAALTLVLLALTHRTVQRWFG